MTDLWRELGFEPWSWDSLDGVRRRVTFRKSSLLGEVARYLVDDYIVWDHCQANCAEYILANWQPAEDVMTHRFLVLGGQSAAPRKKHYLFGFKGWVEILDYRLGDPEVKKFQDLIFIANKAWEYLEKEGARK